MARVDGWGGRDLELPLDRVDGAVQRRELDVLLDADVEPGAPLRQRLATQLPRELRVRLRVLVVTSKRVVVHEPRPACAANLDRVVGAVAPARDLHGRCERRGVVQLVLAEVVLVAGVVEGPLQQSPRLVLRGALVQAPSLGVARVGSRISLVVVVITETHTRVIRPTDSNAPTRETYLLWQAPRTVLGVRRVRGRDQRAIPGQPIFIGHPTYVRPRVADLV